MPLYQIRFTGSYAGVNYSENVFIRDDTKTEAIKRVINLYGTTKWRYDSGQDKYFKPEVMDIYELPEVTEDKENDN